MGAKDQYYYQILGIPPGSSREDVRAAYRRLVRQYHPDVNPAPEAKEKFQEIARAYEYLTKTPSEEEYSSIFSEQPAEDPLKAWREELKAKRAQKEKEKAQQKQQMLQKVYRVINFLLAFYLLFVGVLTVDYFLPAVEHPEEVEKVVRVYSSSSRYSRGRVYLYDDIYFQNFKLRVSKEEDIRCCGEGIVYATPIFGTVLEVALRQNGQLIMLEPAYGFYHFFGFLIPLAFLLGLIYYRMPSTTEFKLNIGLVLIFISIFHLLLLTFLEK